MSNIRRTPQISLGMILSFGRAPLSFASLLGGEWTGGEVAPLDRAGRPRQPVLGAEQAGFEPAGPYGLTDVPNRLLNQARSLLRW